MPHIIVPPSWRIRDREVTPESVYWNRRHVLHSAGLAGLGALALSAGCSTPQPQTQEASPTQDAGPSGGTATADVDDLYPATRNEAG